MMRRGFASRRYYVKLGGAELEVTWKAPARCLEEGSCLYHATADGVTPVCGAAIGLGDAEPYPSTADRSDDIMTCDHCAGRVFRAPATKEGTQ